MKTLMIVIAVASLLAGNAAAQESHRGHGQTAADLSPYAGFQSRSIKSLSDEQVADLRSGRGMGLALAAELNGFPGPTHVLELAGELGLSEAQRSQTEAAVRSMKSATITIGERIIAAERELNRLFAEWRIDHARLAAVTARIGSDQGALRSTHLMHHIDMAELLTPTQIERYGVLRGYTRKAP
jgi:Spy/CpxP family protein refolding chaperone